MKAYKYILATAILGTSLCTTSCRDDFAQLNSNPSQITVAEPTYLFAQAVIEFEPSGYTYWFYNAPMMYKWGQMGTPSGGFTELYAQCTETGEQGGQNRGTLKYVRALDKIRAAMPPAESAKYNSISAALNVMTAYLGIFDTDMYGDIPFSEACRGTEGLLTPKYDDVKDLYTLWLKQLDDAIEIFTTSKDQVFPSLQDPIYKGDVKKWAKLANSLKLKLAVRLLNDDKAKAFEIANQVGTASCGVLDGPSDDFLFNKAGAVTNDDNDKVYHWSNGFLGSTAASKRVADFMLKNEDPRIRFFYKKNSWNSKIVQAFFDANKDIPAYILSNVDYTVDASGKKKFVNWKGQGEPWVRYYGLPVEMEAKNNLAVFGDYFDANRFKLDDKNSYIPYSTFQQEMIIGRLTFTLPVAPGGPVIEDKDPAPWYGMYMSTSEVNLYLAELKTLGANLPQTADAYFKKAVRASVTEYDRLAGLNNIPYYKKTYGYDPKEVSIELKEGELDKMMLHTDYQLTGNKALDLEKIYLQELIHFTLYPNDQFITVRRSGCPKVNSNLIKWENFTSVPVDAIPRRLEIAEPSPTDKMKSIITESVKKQGFTFSFKTTDTKKLNSERVWQDKKAPQFGAGPIF